ncbi:HAD family hydrolase [Shimia ponticola]|uniref:HAD family hydrolase n=1 Tax=Shimia ponticola TaxID=2582893 RepID=UPI00164B0B48|nr:HAD family phosphatase [Shimia ponticola]
MTTLGVLFDMDGLLLDTERVGMQAFQETVAPLGMGSVQAEAFYLSLVGGTRGGTIDAIANTLTEHDADEVYESWRAAFGRKLSDGVPLRPTVLEALSRLEASGVPMAVVTSTQGADARHHLAEAGILRFFVGVIGGDDVKNGKPDPEPYQRGADLLSIAPEKCAAFEDSDTGTLAAVTARCRTWQIPDLRPAGRPIPAIGQGMASSLLDAVFQSGLIDAKVL